MTEPLVEGVRARKRRETYRRISEAGITLFLEKGYEATTLDAIAQAAGISRRTFFAYFKSKDDVVLAWQAAGWEAFLAELGTVSSALQPLDAVLQVMLNHVSRYEGSEHMRAIDTLMLASESLQIRKQAVYLTQEIALSQTLSKIWPQVDRQDALKVVAMVSVGAMRLALRTWRAQTEKSLADVLTSIFICLKSEI